MFVYLIGGRRSFWHPVVMGISTAVSHSASLIAIAFVVHLTHHFVTDDHHHEAHVSTVLQWISATLLVGIGGYLMIQVIRGKKSRDCCCGHSHAADCNRDGIPNEPQLIQLGSPTTNAPVSTAPQRMGNLKMTALLGLAVGLLPCPSAMAAYFAGLSSGSPTKAYLIIALFGAGIASSLTIVGIFLQCFGDRLGAGLHRASHIPWGFVRALLILGIGAFYMGRMVIA